MQEEKINPENTDDKKNTILSDIITLKSNNEGNNPNSNTLDQYNNK